jgi:hypothetical protein
MFYLQSVLFAQGDFIRVLWDRKRIVEMRYYFSTQDDKNKEQKWERMRSMSSLLRGGKDI